MLNFTQLSQIVGNREVVNVSALNLFLLIAFESLRILVNNLLQHIVELSNLPSKSPDIGLISEETVDFTKVELENLLDFTLENDVSLNRVLLFLKL